MLVHPGCSLITLSPRLRDSFREFLGEEAGEEIRVMPHRIFYTLCAVSKC